MLEKLKVVMGDITHMEVDAIVNAANTDLAGGGGVDGAIHKAAGVELLSACQKLNGCATGHAKLTPAFGLPAKFVIHTVGPIWRGGAKGEMQQLASCYVSTLELAKEHGVKTIAFPAISCGIYGYPLSQATTIALKETANFLELHPEIETVYFVCFDTESFEAYQQTLSTLTDDES